MDSVTGPLGSADSACAIGALAASGLLNPEVGGPSVFPYQPDGVWAMPYSDDKWTTQTNGNQFRRGLYTFWRRTSPPG